MGWWTDDIGSSIMDSLSSWIFNQVAEVTDVLTIEFLNDFQPDITFFKKTFPSAASYYEAFVAIGVLLIIGIFFFSMLFMLLGIITGYEENPIKMIGRVIIALLMTYYSASIMDEIYKIGDSIFEILSAVQREENWLEGSSLLNFLRFDIVAMALKVIIGIIILWNLIKLFLEIMERYIVMCLFYYLSPIANASFTSKATSRIFSTFYGSVMVQVLVCSLNIWFLKLTTDICIAEIASNASATQILMHGLLTIAWLLVAQNIDEYLKSMGFGAVQTGSDLGHAVLGTVMTLKGVAGMAMNGKNAIDKVSGHVSGQNGFKDAMGKMHTSEGNRNVSNAANMTQGVMNSKKQVIPGQDAYMSTDNKGNASATIIGDAAKEVVNNSNVPGMQSNSVIQETLNAGAVQGSPFKFNYQTSDGSKVSGHISRLEEENGVKGIPSVGATGQLQYTYFDKGSGLSTGTGLEQGQTSTVFDANMATSSKDSEGNLDINTGAWNQTTMEAIGFEKSEMDSHLTLEEQGKVRVDDAQGNKMGTVLTSDNKNFEASKGLGSYYVNPTNGNQMVGFPESKLDGLSLDPDSVAKYPEIQKIMGNDVFAGNDVVAKGNQTLETDGIQSYVAMTHDGNSIRHDFVTTENLDFNNLHTYQKVKLPNGGIIYHRSKYATQENQSGNTKNKGKKHGRK